MNLLFLNPPFKGRFSRASRSPAVTRGGTLYYPLWLAYAVGVAEQAGHEVRFYDAPAEGLTVSDVLVRLDDFRPELIIVDTSTPSIYADVKVAQRLKERYPQAFVLLVGTHPSALPQETLNLSGAIDGVAMGEYDYTIRDLAGALETRRSLAQVDGLVFRENNQLVSNRQRVRIEDLDPIPFVASVYRKHLDYRNYFFAAASYPMVMIITGRGCPYRCFFCVYPQVFHGRRYRMRSPENVVEELAYIQKTFPNVKEIGIEDDCFTSDKKRVERICTRIIAKNLHVKWYCNVRGDLDYPLLKLMRQAGCRLVTVGFESGSQQVLDNMHKRATVERYHQFARDAHRAGLLVHGCIMTGNPGDTPETLKQGYELARKMDCDSMQFYPLYVYPGTEAYDWALKEDYLQTEDFSKWLTPDGFHNCVINTPQMSGKEMVTLCDHYLKKYHLRPGYLLRKAWQAVRHPAEGYRSLKSGKVFLQSFFKSKES